MAELKKIIVDGVEHTLPQGGSGTSQVFVDVDSLPTENINSDVIYRLFKVYGIINGTPQTNTTVHIVDSLPTTGENCTTDGSTFTNMYYNKSDDNVYGYVNATIGAAFGVPAGWYPAANLLQIANLTYGGIVDSIVGLEEDTYYFVREYDFYIYKGKWIKLDNDIVFQGEGLSSVVMNNLGNVASGKYSVAEGRETTASGNYSHAEGYVTTASGSDSHAEGASTTASGNCSHAEGHITTASGMYSHAEGRETTASSDYSHAEGYNTTASGTSSHAEGASTTASGPRSHAEGACTTAASEEQHVQGRYNIEDSSNKYAHIVGNGSSQNNRSNAHTLDWDGNAWYQGDIKTGGTTYDDAPNTVVTSLGTPTDSGQILIGNTDGTAEWSTETLSELSQRITNLEQSGGGGGGSSINKYELVIDGTIPEIPTDASLGTYTLTETQLNTFQGLGSTYLNRTYLPTISASIGIKMSMDDISMEAIEQMVGCLSTEIVSGLSEGYIQIDFFKFIISGSAIATPNFCITLNASGGRFTSGTLQYNINTYYILQAVQQGFGSVTITIEYRE